jgi:glycosyltransferase involved in cell wall biosynthesis
MKNSKISANILVRNEIKNIKGIVENLCEAGVDEILFLDGGSEDGTYEYLAELELKEKKIKVFRWPQPKATEYKKGFNEVGRRNFLIDQSTSEFILYIDADERISINLNQLIDIKSDLIAISLISYWGNHIRVNSEIDKVWYPMTKYRIFRRNPKLRFHSRDSNGLHNYLGYLGMKIPMPKNKTPILNLLSKIILIMMPIKVQILENEGRIYHYHYYYLNRRKTNDLRSLEIDWNIQEVNKSQAKRNNLVVYVSRHIAESTEARYITEQFWKKFQE